MPETATVLKIQCVDAFDQPLSRFLRRDAASTCQFGRNHTGMKQRDSDAAMLSAAFDMR